MFGHKNLGSVSVTSISITRARNENVIILDKVLYIHYLVQFQNRGKAVTRTLINSSSEINAMALACAKQLGL